MPKALKAKWLAALRSGKYKQCTQYPTDGKGAYCCLGVLQKVATKKEPPKLWGDDGKEDAVPRVIAFVRSKNVNGLKIERRLARLNDGDHYTGERRHSFAEIADYIELNL